MYIDNLPAMENSFLLIPAFIISLLVAYGYYLTLIERVEEFEKKRERNTSYRTIEEFVNY